MTMPQTETAVECSLPPVRPPRRRRWVSFLLGCLVFLGGFIAGGGAVLKVIQVRLTDAINHPEHEAALRTAELRKQLKLSPAQTQQVEAILRNRVTSIIMNARGQMDLLSQEVSRVLTEEQRARWEKIHAQRTDPWLPKPPPGAKAESGKRKSESG